MGPIGALAITRHLVANLPYNVAVPVVMRLLEEAPAIDRSSSLSESS